MSVLMYRSCSKSSKGAQIKCHALIFFPCQAFQWKKSLYAVTVRHCSSRRSTDQRAPKGRGSRNRCFGQRCGQRQYETNCCCIGFCTKMCSTGGWKTLFLDPHVLSSVQSSVQASSPTAVNASMQATSPTTVKVEIPHQGYFHRDCRTDKPSNVKTKNEVHVNWPFECHLCPESFSLKETLNKHLCTHTGTRTFQCSSCPRSFRQKFNLERHLRIHTGERPFQCPSCPRSFSQGVNLKTHLSTHTGEKPFQCPSCPRSFRQRGNLKTHQRIHTGERPHQCSLCPRRFFQGHNLKRHLRTHTGERPFQCPSCPRSFRQRGNLKTHQRVHTGERPL
ncbi:uncharacterized protein [Dermacentor andersoni]|uniref:uncharacterized protein isoform X2 n=1 Tax=Dermacentor andersoni TaxID=34620 RepID=UPI003B3B2876